MKNNIKNIFLIVIFSICGFSGFAQVFPVQVTPVFSTPYTSKISEYATSFDTKFQLIVNPTDISINNRQVRFKISIQGNGINAQSADFITGQNPIYINGGELITFTNVELAALFRLENLQGISAVQYANPLPEGSYSFCFEMYDFFTNQRISQKSCANIYLMLNEPPILNLPTKQEQIAVSDFPNIFFTWTPQQINATNVSYKFELKEILDPNIDPQYGFEISPLRYEEELFTPFLVYDNTKPFLIPNRRYAWRVRAISTSGLSENAIFKNNGYSEVFWFTYASNCPAPTSVFSTITSSKSVKITWEGAFENTKYHVQYKKRNVASAQWFSVYTLNTQATITDLEAETAYEFRVGASCEPAGIAMSYNYSGINNFDTPVSGSTSVGYNCGINPAVSITNQTPLPNLIPSETFTAGDFPVKVLEVSGSNGMFTGIGYITVPYLADSKIAVIFNNVTINTAYQLINGIVETTYDPKGENITNVDPLIDDIINAINTAIQNLQTLITQSQNTQTPIDPSIWVAYQQSMNQQWQLLFNNANLPQTVQDQINQLLGNSYLASTSNTPPNTSELGTAQQQLSELAAIQTSIQESQKGVEKLITALKSFGTDTFIKCKKCDSTGQQAASGFDGASGVAKKLGYFGKSYVCMLASLNSNATFLTISDNLNTIVVDPKNTDKIKKLVNETKTIFNAFKPELLVLLNQNEELVQCAVKYPFSGEICQQNYSVSDIVLGQIAEEVSLCFVNKMQDYLIAAKADKRQNQSIEFENNGKVYKLNSENKAVLVANQLSDAQINAGSWTETSTDVKIRYFLNENGILQMKAVGIRSNLVLATVTDINNIPRIKEAKLVDIAQNIKTKGNNFFIENKVTNGKETPTSKSINLNANAEEFADGKKIAIDNESSFFKIVSEGIGLTTTLLKTALVEDKTYLNTTENTASIHAPGLVTGTVEAGTKVVTDITGIVTMVYDISVDKEARKQVCEGLKKIKTQIGNDYSQLMPMLKDVIVEEATGNTPENWSLIINPNTDTGKTGHLATKGAVRTCVTIFTASTIITKLPEMADNLVKKMDDLLSIGNKVFNSAEELATAIYKARSTIRKNIINLQESKDLAKEFFEHIKKTDTSLSNVQFDDWFINTFKKFESSTLNFEAHHVIPADVLKNNPDLKELLFELRKTDSNFNFDFNGIDNGMMIQKKSNALQINGHTVHNDYNREISKKISELIQNAATKEKAFEKVKKLISDTKNKLKQEVLLGTKNVNEIVNF
ncbi:AHH domain-containing protein [Flavobacterium sp.]|uniref:AHH domain-containing protein n=1 Tax=Flavobacterium sp. TaxID=239 RepID=UPI00286AB859|nr:AHH domain-containing protein [Flavobacterium sp.]